jgi:phospholipase/lecithinase/hemolysin
MLAIAAVLVACSDGTPSYIEGFAATGAALANADVTAKCVEGPAVTGKTDAEGLFQLRIDNGQVAPCLVQVSGGGTTLHSFASGPGRLNVTPLTELSVGKAFGEAPSTAFAAFDKAKSTKIADGLTSATAAVKAEVEALTGKTIAGNMFTATFKVGDPDDRVLDALKDRLDGLGQPLADLVAAASTNKPLAELARRVMVFGDSLSDSGTFGLKFTVQGSTATGAGSSDIWVDLVAREYQKKLLCAYYRSSTGNAPFTTQNGCTNYAIGGGRINYASSPTDPRSIILQLQKAAEVNGRYGTSDVLLIDGGGNDAADLAGAWLADPQAFQALLSSVLGAQATGTLLSGGASGAVLAGSTYMTALADRFADAIEVHAINKGAQKVLVMNLPDIALTPRFSAVLMGVNMQVTAQTQSPQAGAAQAATVKAVIQSWVDAFNNKLRDRFALSTSAGPKVAVLDFSTIFRDQVADPGRYGFTNVTSTACPSTGTDSSGLPSYTFATCTATDLSNTGGGSSSPGPGPSPSPFTSTWWQTYLFSDGFHPTPLAHSKAADQALALLTSKGWR